MCSVDVRNAGDGTLEISICGPSGQNLSNNVTAQGPGMFLVNYVPCESGQHRANVTFNKENIRGTAASRFLSCLRSNARNALDDNFSRPYWVVRPYWLVRSRLWYDVLSVYRLSVVCLSVTFCIVAKLTASSNMHVLPKNISVIQRLGA